MNAPTREAVIKTARRIEELQSEKRHLVHIMESTRKTGATLGIRFVNDDWSEQRFHDRAMRAVQQAIYFAISEIDGALDETELPREIEQPAETGGQP